MNSPARGGSTQQPDYLPISMLNQLAYCERRFWLMYVCGEMQINAAVLEGMYQHQRAHAGGAEQDGGTITHRRVYLWSDRLRIVGFADLVEERVEEDVSDALQWSDLVKQDEPIALPWFEQDDQVPCSPRRVLIPVEYKHGAKGRWANDRIQLCAQALCLEERTGRTVARGEIFYWRSRRRVDVPLTPELRAQTQETIARAFALLAAGKMPPPVEKRARCRGCSLEDVCLPREVLMLTKGEERGAA